jgi:hypothetical protein
MEFEEAVIEISLLYEKAKETLGDDLSEVWRHGVIDFWADVHKWDIDWLIDDATVDARRFEIIAKSIAKLIENDVPLTEKAKLWLVGLLNGEISKPDSKEGRNTTTGRDSFGGYAWCIVHAAAPIMTPTIKNDAQIAAINGSGLKSLKVLASKRVPQLGHSLLMELQTASQV